MERKNPHVKIQAVATLCINLAKVLIASGAETSRVEETVSRVGHACKIDVDSMVTPTGITVSVGGERAVTRIARVKTRTIDLSKVVIANHISRQLSAGDINLPTAKSLVAALLEKAPLYSTFIMTIAQALSCVGFTLILGGGIPDLLPSFMVGLEAKWVEIKCAKLSPFLAVFFNALSVTLFAYGWNYCVTSINITAIIIAGMIPLLPGLSLTNAIVDLMAGELVAGMARTIDSILVAAALAAGAAAGVNIGQLL